MKAYPTVQDTPDRKRRKAVRKKIFEENRIDARTRRKARRDAKRKTQGE